MVVHRGKDDVTHRAPSPFVFDGGGGGGCACVEKASGVVDAWHDGSGTGHVIGGGDYVGGGEGAKGAVEGRRDRLGGKGTYA